MAVTRILLWLGNALVLCAVMMAVTAIFGASLGESTQALVFAGLAMAAGVAGAIFILTTRNTPARESNSDALAFLVLFWLFMPLLCALPYLVDGIVPSFRVAYFESVSAITTTGASTLLADDLPRTLLVWRSILQWFGGVSAATFAVVILAALNLSGTGIHRSMLFTLKKGELFVRLVGIGRVVGGVYLTISSVCFTGLLISGTKAFDAFCLALTSVSTGGLTPRDGPLSAYVSPAGAIVLSLACLAGAASIAVLWDWARLRGSRGIRPVFRNVEHRGLFAIIAVLIVIGIIFAGPAQMGTVILEAVMFASSAGFDYHVIGLDMIPPTVLIALALIGGAALSTTGGIKIIRFVLLFRHLITDLSRLPHPSRVKPVIFRGRLVPDHAFLSIWMYFFGYTFVFAAGIIGLGAAGLGYETAVATSAASLANIGPLLDATMPDLTYRDFNTDQLLVASGLMLVGRVEVLAAFAAIFTALNRK